MGNGHSLHPHQTRSAVPVYDPGPQQHCVLQNRNGTNGEPGSGHYPTGSTQRKEEGRRRVATPQRPRCSVRLTNIFFVLTQQYGITPSMLRRGNPYENAMADNFFSILKTECIYRRKPATFSEANQMIDHYIHSYNRKRIQSITGMVPLTLRYSC